MYSHCHNQTPLSFRFSAFEVTLSGFAGGEYLPLPASEGPAFPFLLTLDGYPTSPAIYAQGQRCSLNIKHSGNTRVSNIGTKERFGAHLRPFYFTTKCTWGAASSNNILGCEAPQPHDCSTALLQHRITLGSREPGQHPICILSSEDNEVTLKKYETSSDHPPLTFQGIRVNVIIHFARGAQWAEKFRPNALGLG